MGTTKCDHIKRLITLIVITLSGFHCICVTNVRIVNNEMIQHFFWRSSVIEDNYIGDQGLISPMFREQFLHVKISKVSKYTNDLTIFVLLGSALIKAAHETLVKWTPSQITAKFITSSNNCWQMSIEYAI